MKAYRYLWLPLLLLSALHAATPLELEWKPVPNAALTARESGLSLALSAGGFDCRAVAVPAAATRLDGNRYLTFRIRTTDGTRQRIAVRLERRRNGNTDAFVSHVEAVPEWQPVRLALNRGNELPEDGCFGYWRDRPGNEPDLGLGGELTELAVFADAAVELELQDFALTPEEPEPSAELLQLARELWQHPTTLPYRFQQEDPSVRIRLADNGRTNWSIVPADADATVQFAARELADYLRCVTGAEFAVTDTPTGPAIRLQVKAMASEDGFTGAGGADGIELTGASPRGVLFAVYDWLEKAAGVRWYTPAEYGTVIPARPELEIPGFRDESHPAFDMRRSHYCSWWGHPDYRSHSYAMAQWCIRNRFNVVLERFDGSEQETPAEFYRQRGTPYQMKWVPGHNFRILIPPEVYGAEHPEYFAFNRETGQWQTEDAQLCAVNPDLHRLLAQKADEYFAESPQEKYFPLFQEDGYARWCQCPGCEALASTATGNFSGATDRNIHLANQVCRLIREKHPERGVITFAYSFTARPPQTEHPDPAVRVVYCYYTDGFPEKLPWQTRGAGELLEWQRLTDGNLAIYTYHYLDLALQMTEPESLTTAFRFFNLLRLRGSIQESAPGWGSPDAYLIYLGGRLAWNPWYDEAALRSDYFAGLYGQAGTAVREYFDTLTTVMRFAPGNQTHIGWSFFPNIPDAALDRMEQALNRAEQAVGDDPRARQALAAQQDYYRLFTQLVAVTRLLEDYYRSPTPEQLPALDAGMERMTELARPLWDAQLLPHYGEERLLHHWYNYLHDIYPKLMK